jgi:putative glutamine amidotransferase
MNIGLTYTGSEQKQHNYIRWLSQGNKVDVITLSSETKENKGSIEDCDALVLSGGIDVHPGYYNSDNLVYPNKPQQFYEKRDAFEKNLFSVAQQRKIPVLGICRGMQLINCILGGTLQQDLAGKNTIHKAVVDEKAMQFDKVHGLHIAPATILYEISGGERAAVNSAHHQGIAAVAAVLQVSAVSDDGVAEALEWKDKAGRPFLLCVQWHPERMQEFLLEQTPMAAGIRTRFLAALKK